MPVIEYCTFLVALCLNCQLFCNGDNSYKSDRTIWKTWQGFWSKCFWTRKVWVESFLIRSVLSFGLWALAVLWCCAWKGNLSSCAPTKSLQLFFITVTFHVFVLKLPASALTVFQFLAQLDRREIQYLKGFSVYTWLHYILCFLPIPLLNWDDTCIFFVIFFCSYYSLDSFFFYCNMRLP